MATTTAISHTQHKGGAGGGRGMRVEDGRGARAGGARTARHACWAGGTYSPHAHTGQSNLIYTERYSLGGYHHHIYA